MPFVKGANPPPPPQNDGIFQLVLANEKIVLIKGSTDISVFMAIMKGADTLASIVKITGLKKSTAFSSLNRLWEKNAIYCTGNDDDRRWHTDACRIMESVEPDTEPLLPYHREAMHAKDDGYYKRIFTNALMTTSSIGLSLEPILNNIAIIISHKLLENLPISDKKVDTSLESCVNFLTGVDMAEIEVLDYIPLRLSIRLTAPMTHSAAGTYIRFVSIVIASFISACTGDVYNPSKMEATDESCCMVTISPTNGTYPHIYGNNLLHKFPVRIDHPTGIKIILTERNVRAVEEANWIKIIEQVQGKPMTASCISDATGIPLSTTSANLRKMVDEGILKETVVQKDSLYSPSIEHIISWGAFDPSIAKRGKYELDSMMSDPESFFLHFMSFLILETDALGLDLRGALFQFSSQMADVMVDENETMTVKEAISALSRNGFRTIHPLSFLPFTLVVVSPRDLDDRVASIAADFDIRYFSRLLERITGHRYVLSDSEIYGIGHRNHKFTLRPSV